MEYGLLINYAYCTGCHSCEFACRNEKNLSLQEWGIKVFQLGPWEQGGKIEWNYLPAPSELCDLCDERVKTGKEPNCVHHCLAQCMEYGPIDKLKERMSVLGKKNSALFALIMTEKILVIRSVTLPSYNTLFI